MAGYAVTNWSKRTTSGIYGSESAARDALPRLLSPGDDYSIVAMPTGTVGAGEIIEDGVFESS